MKKEPDFPIDFVIPWVDGGDAIWKRKKSVFQGSMETEGNAEQRYRDFGTLKYLFRSIEKYAHWVNRIWLVTDQQVPDWLLENEQVKIINHEEYIPNQYLPTFNSNVIELNVGRIDDLEEHFVMLNDDFLFVQKTIKSDFFSAKGEPKDISAQSVFMPRDDFSHIPINNIILINQFFIKKRWLKKNWRKAFSIKNGIILNVLSIMLSPLPYFTRFYEPHVGVAYLKSNFKKIWELFPEKLEMTSKNKFRDINEVSHWLVRYYQIVTGQVVPRSYKFGKYFNITESNKVKKALKSSKNKMIVINDGSINDSDYELAKETMEELQKFFVNKSKYEK